jgi:hypothetical protein
MGLTRKQIREGLEQVPIDRVIGVSSQLTGKQRAFAAELAAGSTKAGAYRKAYNSKGKAKTTGDAGYRLSLHSGISAEVEALKLASEAAKYRNAGQLRDLVIHSLVQVVIDPDAKPSVKIQAAKILGNVTEVAAFTERKEITTIKTSTDARAQIMQQLRDMMKAGASDAVEVDAVALLEELAPVDPHPTPTPLFDQAGIDSDTHTIPHEGSSPQMDTKDANET